MSVTKREANTRDRLIEFVTVSTEKRGFPPTVREIQEELGFASVSSVQHHIAILRAEGRIRTIAGGKRTITVVNRNE